MSEVLLFSLFLLFSSLHAANRSSADPGSSDTQAILFAIVDTNCFTIGLSFVYKHAGIHL